jgi:acyl-coenzyme A thioesterase PaaI-like protein
VSALPDWGWDPEHGHHDGCHACRADGLGLRVWAEGQVAHGEAYLGARLQGSPNHVHGGVLAEMFDDVLGTVSMLHGVIAVTGTLQVRYRAPAFLEQTYHVQARLVSREGRKLMIAGEMTGPQGLVAEADGTWVQVALDHFDSTGG